jgi:hypothetical protein
LKAAAFPILLASACVSWAQSQTVGVQTNARPVGVYKLNPGAQPVALTFGKPFTIKLDRNQDVPVEGPFMVRIFEGPHDRLIDAANRTAIGDCVRYEIPEVNDLWVARDGSPRRYVLVPENGNLSAGTIWLDRAGLADYFNSGIEVEVRLGIRPVPDYSYIVYPRSRTAATAPAASTGGATQNNTLTLPPFTGTVQPVTIDCVRVRAAGTTPVSTTSAGVPGTLVAQVRECKVI